MFHAWNVGGACCGRPGQTSIDDVGFVVAVVDSIGEAMPVDAQRTFATGISNGGMLAYHLACSTSIFAAIGPVAATELGACPDPEPLSVIHVHGTADTNIRYDGSQGAGVGKIDGPPVPDLIASWRAVDGCGPPTATTADPVTVETATCPSGRAVELVSVAGAGHQWPGAQPNPRGDLLGLDPPSNALDATKVIWDFFEAHPRRDR
jgi:polyhydroxybutyrate depolymerase